jgi:hypothetical protein
VALEVNHTARKFDCQEGHHSNASRRKLNNEDFSRPAKYDSIYACSIVEEKQFLSRDSFAERWISECGY